MNEADIEAALKARIRTADLDGLKIVYPNSQTKYAVPYAVVAVQFTDATDVTIDGSKPMIQGFVMVTAVTSEGTGTREASTIAAAIKALFPMGYRITLADGVIEIKKPPSALAGFLQGGAWRQPVKITFDAG
jgi:hypothetical protein